MAPPTWPKGNTSNDEGASHCYPCGEPLTTGTTELTEAPPTSGAQWTTGTPVERAVMDGLQALPDEQRQQAEHLKRFGTVGQILLVLMVLASP